MNKQHGLSIVELLVALVISLLVIAGVGQAFVSHKMSFRAQNALSRIQQTGRFAIDYVSKDIHIAGFPKLVEQSNAFFDAIIPSGTAQGSAEGGGNNSDRITLMHQTDEDCLGNATPVYADGNQYAKNQYRIDANGDLVCRTFDAAGGQIDSQVLARGIENMQVLYGIDTDADAIANSYVDANTIANWNLIISVRITFLVNSVETTATSADTNTYVLLDGTPIGPFNDNMRRRIFTTTAVLRNRTI